jgi:hypothetical protein
LFADQAHHRSGSPRQPYPSCLASVCTPLPTWELRVEICLWVTSKIGMECHGFFHGMPWNAMDLPFEYWVPLVLNTSR